MWFNCFLSVVALLALKDNLGCSGKKFHHLIQGSCGPGQFECDGKRCLEMKLACNTEFNCEDRTDEFGCICYHHDLIPCGDVGRCVSKENFCKGDKEGCSKFFEVVVDCSQWVSSTAKPTEDPTEGTTEVVSEHVSEVCVETTSYSTTETATEGTSEVATETTTEYGGEVSTEPVSENGTDISEPVSENGTDISEPVSENGTDISEPVSENATDISEPLTDSGTESFQDDTMTTEANDLTTVRNESESVVVDAPRGEHYTESDSNEDNPDWKSYAIPGGIIIGLLPVALIIFFLIRRQRSSANYSFSPYEKQTQKC